VVLEERRMRRDSSPVGQLWELTMAAAFIAHPYRYPVIGWEADISRLKASEAFRFYETHYTPDRAVGAIVGDIDIEATRRLLRDTFGRILPGEGDAPPSIVPEPPQRGERRTTLRIEATPALLMAWHKPSAPHPDDVTAEALTQILTGGRSARWFEKFVKQERIAAELAIFTGPGDAEPNLLILYAAPRGETTLDALEESLRREVAGLTDAEFSPSELERAKKNLRADTIRALETNLGLARALAETASIGGDPYYLERRLRRLELVTADDLRAFARRYLTDENLTVGRLEPPAGAEDD
jgi:predicted Zn-dependent peptidase